MAGYPRIRRDLPWTPDAIKGYVGCLEPSDGVHDSLQAVAFAIEVSGARAVFVGLDTLVVTAGFTEQVRAALAEDGVVPDNVLIGASHTHAGPDVFAYWEGDPETTRAVTLRGAIEAAHRALAALEEAQVFSGTAMLGDVSINRRDERLGPIDPSVNVIAARSSATGGLLGMLVNFACHPITLDYSNTRFSADYVWGMRETVRAVHPGAEVAFLNGAAGNINPAGFPYTERANIYIPQTKENYPVYWGGFEDSMRTGRMLGTAAIQAAGRAVPLDITSIDARRAEVELPLKRGEALDAFLEFMSFLPPYRDHLRSLDALPSEVQRIRLGDLTIAAMPGEPFVELGLELKAEGPEDLIVVGYANDDVRYVLTDDSYDGSQYETVGTPLDQGAAPTLVRAVQNIL